MESNMPARRVGWKKNKPFFRNPAAFVTFIIGTGDNEETSVVHEEFACYSSPVFKAAFNGPFVEGETKTYRLDDVEPDLFRLMVVWFYTQSAEQFFKDFDDAEGFDKNLVVQNDPEMKALFEKQDLDLVKLWILADRLLMPELQNQTMIQLDLSLFPDDDKKHWECHESCWLNTSWFNEVYAGTTAGSPLRKFAIDYYKMASFHWRRGDCPKKDEAKRHFVEHAMDVPPEMLFEVTQNILFSEVPLVQPRSKRDYSVGPLVIE